MILKGTLPLSTKRLKLRKIKVDDYKQAYSNWYNSSKVAELTLSKKHLSPQETKNLFEYYEREYINLYTYRWIIELKETKEIIGIIEGVQNNYTKYNVLELGFCIGEKYWNKGYATEAIIEVIKFLFEEIEVETIYAECLDNNKGSNRVLQKANMNYEGKLIGRLIDNKGNRVNLNSYSIQKEK